MTEETAVVYLRYYPIGYLPSEKKREISTISARTAVSRPRIGPGTYRI
jgi:hypothetical protein